VSSSSLKAVRASRRAVRRLEPFIPVGLFLCPLIAAAALAAVVGTGSVVLIVTTTTALVVSLAGLAAWTLTADRRARKPPAHVAWSDHDWERFERALWTYIRLRSIFPDRPRQTDK
jgi:hypothetical protein